MKIGYACVNTSLNCSSSRTFRLANFSEQRFLETTKSNLACLQQILEFNRQHRILFFRISSGLIPFASHPVCTVNWQKYFAAQFHDLGKFIQKNNTRVSMHPGQYTIVNSPRPEVVANSVRDLVYHAEVLDLMGLPVSHKVQIHLGGVYGDRLQSRNRFVAEYRRLPSVVRRRLVLENDERCFSAADCLAVAEQVPVPIVIDVLHHQLLNNGESIDSVFRAAIKTWRQGDGLPIVDYSNQDKKKRIGAHSVSIDKKQFQKFLTKVSAFHFDLMFEVKDKEQSVLSVEL